MVQKSNGEERTDLIEKHTGWKFLSRKYKEHDNMKNLILIIIVMVVSINYCGCSGKRDKREEEKILLRWSAGGYVGYDEFRKEASKKFEEYYPNLTVKFEPITGQYNTILLTRVAGHTASDMFFVHDLVTFITKGALVDLTGWYEEDKNIYFKDIWPILIESHVWEGKLYALPGNCSVDILYYNRTLFLKIGIAYPDESWTLQTFLEAARRLTIRDEQGKIIQYGCITPHNSLKFILHYGEKVWNENKSRCVINSQEAQEAIEFWKDFYAKYQVAPSMLERREEGSREPFISGRAAIYWGSSWEVATFKIKGSNKLDWDATRIPKVRGIERFISLGYNSMGVWTGSKNRRLAYEIARFMTEPERIKFFVEKGDTLPIHSKGMDMDYFLSNPDIPENAKSAMLKSLPSSRSFYHAIVNPSIPSLEQIHIMDEEMDKFIIGDTSAKEVLELIEKKLNDLVEKEK